MSNNFDDTSPAAKAAGIKQAWANPKARKGMLLAGGVLVVVAVVSMTAMKREKPKTNANTPGVAVVAPPSGGRDVTAATPQKYKDLVNESDAARSLAASSTPTAVVMPTLTGFGDPDDERKRRDAIAAAKMLEEARLAAERGRALAEAQARADTGAVRTSAQAAGAAQGSSPQDAIRKSADYIVTKNYLGLVVASELAGRMTVLRPPNAAPVPTSGSSASGSAKAPAPNTPAGLTPAPAMPMIRMGEISFGTIDIAMNTDYSGPVTATLRQGPYAGARLMGTKALEQNALVVKFSMISLPGGGVAVPINAYAVSMGDANKYGLTGLQGDTDYHIFTRYILPAAAAFTQSYGMSAANVGTTTTTDANGNVTQTTPKLTAQDRINIGMGAAMAPILNDVARLAQRPITVSLPAQTEIGIMFASDVMPNGAAGAGVVAPPAAAGVAMSLPSAAPTPYGYITPPGYPAQVSGRVGGYNASQTGDYASIGYPGVAVKQ